MNSILIKGKAYGSLFNLTKKSNAHLQSAVFYSKVVVVKRKAKRYRG